MSVESDILLDGKFAVSGYCLISVESGALLDRVVVASGGLMSVEPVLLCPLLGSRGAVGRAEDRRSRGMGFDSGHWS